MPKRIGKYEVHEELGRGACGRVFRALDPTVGRPVAIKVLGEPDPDLLARFHREAAATAALRHRNIVTVYEFGDHKGVPFIAMEYLEGEDLQKVIADRRPLTLLQKMRIMSQVAEGLHAAHERGVVHRDVKPANIMLLADGAVKIMDFGIARFAASSPLTNRGDVLGTVRYMAPEQFQTGKDVDSRSDLFAYGVVYYELLTGTHPFDGAHAGEVMDKIARYDPPPLSDLLPECPEALENAVRCAMQKEQRLRYRSLADLQLDAGDVILQLQQERAATLAAEADRLLSSGQASEARTLVREILELDPANPEGRRLWQAIRRQSRKHAVGPIVADYLQRAETELTRNNPSEAIKLLGQVLQIDRNNTVAQQRLQEAQARLQQGGGRRPSRLSPAHPPPAPAPAPPAAAWKQQIEQKIAEGALTDAASWIDSSQEQFPGDPDWELLRQKVRERQPQRPPPAPPLASQDDVQAAQTLFAQRRFEEAKTILQRLAAGEPDNATVQALLRAVTLEQSIEHEMQVFRQARENREPVPAARGYRILEKVGAGARGVVYRAVDPARDRTVALRFIPPEHLTDPGNKNRPLRRLETAAALDHPHVARIYEVGERDGRLFVAMEYLDGPTLHHRIADRGLSPAEALGFSFQITEALASAHARGLAHGNLKTGNILLTRDGCPKIVDFGVISGHPSTDIPSLGQVLYHLAAGRPAESPVPTYAGLSPSMASIIRRCLDPDSTQRYRLLAHLLADLRAVPIPAPAATVDIRKSGSKFLLVLPFVHETPEPETAPLADGLVEELREALAHRRGLRVVGSITSANPQVRSLSLEATAVISGRLRRRDATLSVEVELNRTSGGGPTWKALYDRPAGDLFGLSAQIARDIARQVAEEERQSIAPARPRKPAAYLACLQGRAWMRRGTPDALAQGRERFLEGIRQDPQFAPAYAGAAECQRLLALRGLSDPTVIPQAQRAALVALRLGGRLAETHACLGSLAWIWDLDWNDAERELLRALERNPSSVIARQEYAAWFSAQGRVEEAKAQLRLARELDPLSPAVCLSWFHVLYRARQFDPAMEECRKILQLDLEFAPAALAGIGCIYVQKGLLEDAIFTLQTALSLAAESAETLALLGYAYARAGWRTEALRLRETLEKLPRGNSAPPALLALVSTGLGDHEAAFRWLHEAFERRDPRRVYLNVEPEFDALRADQQFQNLLQLLKIPAYGGLQPARG